MPQYSFKSQRNIVVASMALHKYIRLSFIEDTIFHEVDKHPEFVPRDIFLDHRPKVLEKSQKSDRSREINIIRNQIAHSLMM